MRHSRSFRIVAALFGVWFTHNLLQADGMHSLGMSGMAMDGMVMAAASETPMRMVEPSMAGMLMDSATEHESSMKKSQNCSENGGDGDKSVGAIATVCGGSATANEQQIVIDSANYTSESPVPDQDPEHQQCDKNRCPCQALSPVVLSVAAALSWLPEHLIDRNPPQSGNETVYADGQVVLPFANGPPSTVTA